MSDDPLQYSKMMEQAVRGVVRDALDIAARQGLPGRHHFYIGFRTGAPGVSIPDRLAARYPDEMTIVLENQFWDLEVDADGFAVSLSFSGAPQRMVIPFAAVTSFVDPSVDFALQFGAAAEETDGGDSAAPRPAAGADDGDEGGDAGDASVVALDSFRRK